MYTNKYSNNQNDINILCVFKWQRQTAASPVTSLQPLLSDVAANNSVNPLRRLQISWLSVIFHDPSGAVATVRCRRQAQIHKFHCR